jgi:hypothetical protein
MSSFVLASCPPPPKGERSSLDTFRLPQRLELEIDADLYERIEEISIRSGRSIPEIIQALISSSFPINPAERVFR